MLIFCLLGIALIVMGITFLLCNCDTIDQDAVNEYLKKQKRH